MSYNPGGPKPKMHLVGYNERVGRAVLLQENQRESFSLAFPAPRSHLSSLAPGPFSGITSGLREHLCRTSFSPSDLLLLSLIRTLRIKSSLNVITDMHQAQCLMPC